MLTDTRTEHRSLSDRLAEDLRRARRRRTRPRSKRRTTRRPAKLRTDPRVAAFEHQLGETVLGRDMLRLVEQTAEARIAEDVAQCGLETAESTESSLRKRFLRASQGRTVEAVREAESLYPKLADAESELCRWRAESQRLRHERERLEVEVQHLAGYL